METPCCQPAGVLDGARPAAKFIVCSIIFATAPPEAPALAGPAGRGSRRSPSPHGGVVNQTRIVCLPPSERLVIQGPGSGRPAGGRPRPWPDFSFCKRPPVFRRDGETGRSVFRALYRHAPPSGWGSFGDTIFLARAPDGAWARKCPPRSRPGRPRIVDRLDDPYGRPAGLFSPAPGPGQARLALGLGNAWPRPFSWWRRYPWRA